MGRWVLAVIFVGAGIMHFVLTPAYMRIMPTYLPAHRMLVLLSGAFEVLGGVGLMVPLSRRAAAWGLVALLVAVWPANVQMAIDHAHWPAIPVWVLWFRVAMQVPLIGWAWVYTRG